MGDQRVAVIQSLRVNGAPADGELADDMLVGGKFDDLRWAAYRDQCISVIQPLDTSRLAGEAGHFPDLFARRIVFGDEVARVRGDQSMPVR